MAALTGLYISSSYGGVIHLSTNTSIVSGTMTQFQDGAGNNMRISSNGLNSVQVTGSFGVTGSTSITNGLEVKAGDLDFSGGNINIYSGNINQFAGGATLQTTIISGSLTLKQGATGSLLGTASFAVSASYSNNSTSASYSNNSTSASYALNATSASYAATATSASYALNATSASYASLAANSILLNGTASSVFATTGSNTFVGNQTISGSVKGNVTTLAITSQTASLDFNTSNFFTLTLVSGSTTRLNFSNIQSGQAVNLQINQASTSGGSLSFPSTITFPSGSYYTASIAANDIDVISMISFNGTTIRAVASKTFL
jgi:hypothetical protein